MNRVYLYDGSFAGLLCLIKFLWQNKIVPSNIKEEGYVANLFEEKVNLNLIINNDIYEIFIKVFGKNNFKTIYYVYLSTDNNKELIIYYYLKNYFKYGVNLDKMRNKKCVCEALRLREKVGREAHKMKGFVRFRELNNKILYASIEPEHNILSLIMPHFAKRLKNEFFIIKDVKRNLVGMYNKKEISVIEDTNWQIITKEQEEDLFSQLWKTFYENIGIKERKNDRCRRNFMPKKYWEYILEVKDEL